MTGLSRLGRVVAAAGLVFALGGCMAMDGDLEISADDTVSGDFVVTVERAALADAGVSDEEFFARLEEWHPVQQLPAREQASVETYVTSGQVGKKYIYDRVPLTTFNAGQGWQIQHVGDAFIVSGALDLSGVASDPSADTDKASQAWDVTIRMTFPGDIRSANGRREGRRTVVWEPKFGQSSMVSASAADGSSPFALSRIGVDTTSLAGPGGWAIGAAVTVELTVVSVSAYLFWRRRRRRELAFALVGQADGGWPGVGQVVAGQSAAGPSAAGRSVAGRSAAGRSAAGRSSGRRSVGDRSAGDRSVGDRSVGDRLVGDRLVGDRSGGGTRSGGTRRSGVQASRAGSGGGRHRAR